MAAVEDLAKREAETLDASLGGLPPALAALVARVATRPLIPTDVGAPTLHVGIDDLPWLEAGDGGAIQLLHVDLNQGIWISNTRLPPGHRVVRHFHTGHVYAVTHQGRWFYEETPEAVSSPGSYLFEPAGSAHTLCVPADQQGNTIVWFAVFGANINLDADGKVASLTEARGVLDLYRGYCEAMGLDASKLIVVGE